MSEPLFTIRYEGDDADRHSIDMRLLGESLIGIDRIVSDVLVAVVTSREPRRGERAPLILKAREPVASSFELTAVLQELGPLLMLGVPLLTQCGQDIVVDWMKSVLAYFGGKKEQADQPLDAIVKMTEAHLVARDREDERSHERQMAMLNTLKATRERLGPSAADVVAPIGRSVRRLLFGSRDREPFEVDETAADRVRETDEVEFGNIETMLLKTDGFTFHTGKLSVERPDRPGSFMLADVKDPVFEQNGNPYTQAAQRKALIQVRAKAGYKNGRLERIAIFDFGGEIDEPS